MKERVAKSVIDERGVVINCTEMHLDFWSRGGTKWMF